MKIQACFLLIIIVLITSSLCQRSKEIKNETPKQQRNSDKVNNRENIKLDKNEEGNKAQSNNQNIASKSNDVGEAKIRNTRTFRKVLAAFPYQGPSHNMVFHPIIKILLNHGYHVTLVNTLPMQGNYTNLKQITFSPTIASWTDMFEFEKMVSQTGWSARYDLEKLSESFMFPLYKNEEFRQLLASDEHFDVILAEPFFMQEAIVFLGHRFNAPVVAVASSNTNTNQDHNLGRTRNPALEPEWTICSTEPTMSFYHRSINTMSWLLNIIEYKLYYLPKREFDLHSLLYYPGIEKLPPLQELIGKISLTISNSHPLVTFPYPVPPNMILTPGLHIKPDNILPQEFESLMSNAKEGVILFAMGTMTPVSKMKEERDIFIRTFSKLHQLVLWKSDIDVPGLPDNVRVYKWLPQAAILAHENCKLFITHGGMLGKQEAIYYGVPLLSIPLFGDQQENTGHSQASGLGLTLQYYEITDDNLFAAINAILYDKQYSDRLAKFSTIFRKDVAQSESKILYWINHIIEHEGASYLRRDSLQLYWFQYYLLDVFFVLIIFTIVVITILVKCAQGLYRLRFPARKLETPETKLKKQ